MFFKLKKNYCNILLFISFIFIIKENISEIKIFFEKINKIYENNNSGISTNYIQLFGINEIFLTLFEIIRKTLDLLIYTFLRITSPINKFISQKIETSEELIYQIIFCLMLYFIYIIFKVVFKKYYKKS